MTTDYNNQLNVSNTYNLPITFLLLQNCPPYPASNFLSLTLLLKV